MPNDVKKVNKKTTLTHECVGELALGFFPSGIFPTVAKRRIIATTNFLLPDFLNQLQGFSVFAYILTGPDERIYVIAHILYYFSRQNDLVFDPMAGGGVTPDTCLALGRRCWSLDMADLPDTRPEIEPCFWE